MPDRAPVSVVIPCYRCGGTIDRAVASVAAQSILPSEVILIDDCSDDGTLRTLHRIQAAHTAGWISVISTAINSGPGTARNLGWAKASQPFIAFLDADDSWHTKKVEIQYRWMADHPDVVLTGHACLQIDGQTDHRINVMNPFSRISFAPVSRRQLLFSNRFSTRSVMLRSNTARRFQDGKRYSEDYQLWAEICCAGFKCYRSDLPLAYSYKAAYGEGGLSAALWRMEKGQLDTYLTLFKSRYIDFGAYLLLSLWSLVKFLRRAAVVGVIRLRL